MENLSLFTGFKNSWPLRWHCHVFLDVYKGGLKKGIRCVRDTSSQVRLKVHRWKRGTIKVHQSLIYTVVLTYTSL